MKFYYINLQSRPERNQDFFNQFKNTDLIIERIDATTKEEIKFSVTPKSVAACWQSHLKCYEKLLSTNDNHAVIFEDDAMVNDKLLNILEKLAKYTDLSYDLIQLGFLVDKNKITVDSGKIDLFFRIQFKLRLLINSIKNWFNLSKNSTTQFENDSFIINSGIRHPLIINSFEAGTHCYLISRSLATKLLNLNRNPVVIAADLLFIEIANSKKIKSARVSKSLSFQKKDYPTDIDLRNNFEFNFKD